MKSVTSLEVNLQKEANSSSVHVAESPNTDIPGQCTDRGGDKSCEEQPCGYIPDIDTEELTKEQHNIARKMLLGEAESFSKTDDDVKGQRNYKRTSTSLIQYNSRESILPLPDHFRHKLSSMLKSVKVTLFIPCCIEGLPSSIFFPVSFPCKVGLP